MTKVEFKLSEVEEEGVRLLTTCGLAAYVDEAVVWPTRGSDGTALEIQIDDLLSHLTEYWKPLALRQTYPLTLNPARPSLLRAEALQASPGSRSLVANRLFNKNVFAFDPAEIAKSFPKRLCDLLSIAFIDVRFR